LKIVFDLLKLLLMPFALYIKVLSWRITWDDVPRTYASWIVLFCYGIGVGILRYALVDGLWFIASALSMTLSVAFCLLLFRKPGILLILAVGSADFLLAFCTLALSRFGFVYADYWLLFTLIEILCFVRLYYLYLNFRPSDSGRSDIFA
jgi:hypothetical protein